MKRFLVSMVVLVVLMQLVFAGLTFSPVNKSSGMMSITGMVVPNGGGAPAPQQPKPEPREAYDLTCYCKDGSVKVIHVEPGDPFGNCEEACGEDNVDSYTWESCAGTYEATGTLSTGDAITINIETFLGEPVEDCTPSDVFAEGLPAIISTAGILAESLGTYSIDEQGGVATVSIKVSNDEKATATARADIDALILNDDWTFTVVSTQSSGNLDPGVEIILSFDFSFPDGSGAHKVFFVMKGTAVLGGIALGKADVTTYTTPAAVPVSGDGKCTPPEAPSTHPNDCSEAELSDGTPVTWNYNGTWSDAAENLYGINAANLEFIAVTLQDNKWFTHVNGNWYIVTLGADGITWAVGTVVYSRQNDGSFTLVTTSIGAGIGVSAGGRITTGIVPGTDLTGTATPIADVDPTTDTGSGVIDMGDGLVDLFDVDDADKDDGTVTVIDDPTGLPPIIIVNPTGDPTGVPSPGPAPGPPTTVGRPPAIIGGGHILKRLANVNIIGIEMRTLQADVVIFAVDVAERARLSVEVRGFEGAPIVTLDELKLDGFNAFTMLQSGSNPMVPTALLAFSAPPQVKKKA